jgi:hypothetical protein
VTRDQEGFTVTRSLTPSGLPYPESTAPANQGANDIKALALALDGRGHGSLIQAATGSGTAGASQGSFTVTFPKPFKTGTTPLVFPMITQGQSYVLNVISTTVSSFVIGSWYLPNNSWAPAGFTVPYNYLAIGTAP